MFYLRLIQTCVQKILCKDIDIYCQDPENNPHPGYKTRLINPIVGDYGAPSMSASFAKSVTRTAFFAVSSMPMGE